MSVAMCNYAVIFILCKHFVCCLYWNKENDSKRRASASDGKQGFCAILKIFCYSDKLISISDWLRPGPAAHLCLLETILRHKWATAHCPSTFSTCFELNKETKHAWVVVSMSWVGPNWPLASVGYWSTMDFLYLCRWQQLLNLVYFYRYQCTPRWASLSHLTLSIPTIKEQKINQKVFKSTQICRF